MKKLEAKTKEQQDYIAALVEEESCDGDVKVCEGGIDYTVDQCFNVGMSFDTMAEIVDYLRNEPVSEDLEAEIKRYLHELYDRDDTVGDIARYFAKWQKEQMMKGAILETEVLRDSDGDGVDTPYESWLTLTNTEIPELPESLGLKEGDKVKIVIVKDS